MEIENAIKLPYTTSPRGVSVFMGVCCLLSVVMYPVLSLKMPYIIIRDGLFLLLYVNSRIKVKKDTELKKDGTGRYPSACLF